MFEQRDSKYTELKALGKYGLIQHLTKKFEIKNPSTQSAIGDDASILNYSNSDVLVSTDQLIEGVHFDLTYFPLRHLGYKAVIATISDILAMNGIPQQIFVNMAISSRFTVESLEELYAGINLACQKYNIDLAGGDTTSTVHGLYLSLTAVGHAPKSDIVKRSTAQANDLLCITGNIGSAYLGLMILEREKKVFEADPTMQPDLEGHDYILERQLKPEARLNIVKDLHDAGVIPTSMIDISAGLASDAISICKSSGVGCHIYDSKLPIDPSMVTACEELSLDPSTIALNGGEDYELLFTIKQSDYKKVEKLKNITVIGHITPEESGINLITSDDRAIELTAQGWEAQLKKYSK